MPRFKPLTQYSLDNRPFFRKNEKTAPNPKGKTPFFFDFHAPKAYAQRKRPLGKFPRQTLCLRMKNPHFWGLTLYHSKEFLQALARLVAR